ncbi:tRNA (N(6)-L-threonylcarbamoyladenosine(37)-C(2))-methylthiotransferase MtaB [Thermochromatium tepidum]|uniref:tRNA (N(6)-L-threonylcarbamoyladenosine(37)-C(2))-methylthiotransferase MtaB n=1 Tax=Thermochromatium tepidum ATCC 43061 TaxID=316276 RepID=A0A6I6DWY3_THETI|nr:tRNA (N(6)-L-threonylcarbamoyladenosine(37)-C(2))-methylthiotransferase MtaB [Thermochromatium tepidum]QGU32031.1 tRNA (N(6)-L-threonylcarbamoyladenosine(37)-C(2))-methylthiotransferase MtaB [Thermochromatium tepidum ATCC 43061]
MHPRRRVQLLALGCRLNEAELESWARGFEARGFRIVEDETAPTELIVVNTCAVTGEAVRKSRQILRRVRRHHPRARLIVSGCLVSLEDQGLATAGLHPDLIVVNRDKDRLVELALIALGYDPDPLSPEASAGSDPAAPLVARGRQRAFVKVQDGCRHQCTFCIPTWARGPERSRPLPDILREVARLQDAGIHEVVLTGVHLGGYGSDLGTDLVTLIERLLHETGIPRLRLGSLEPWDLPERFWSLFADPRLMPHLHLPLQSGSDRVLRRMARRYRRADYIRLVERARAAIPDLNLTTDIIVGFPGETQDDWHQTLELAESLGFGHIHVFGYSPRPGTVAAGFDHPVDARTRQLRSEALEAVARRSRLQVLRAQIGKTVTLLQERPTETAGGRPRSGYTPNYLPVHVRSAQQIAEGQLIEVRVTGLDEAAAMLLAEPTDLAPLAPRVQA